MVQPDPVDLDVTVKLKLVLAVSEPEVPEIVTG